jgi:potassium-dependent mechanosensitive channel
MRNPYGLLVLMIGLVFACPARAQQDTSRTQRVNGKPDSTRQQSDTTRRGGRAGMLKDLFADSNKLTSSDYQLQIEKTHLILSNVRNKSDLGLPVKLIKQKLVDTDSMLAVLKDNVLNNSAALNLRNLQVFETLLLNIQTICEEDRQVLDSTEARLIDLRNSMKVLIGDTIMRSMWRDSVLRVQFQPQLKGMREAFRGSTKKLKESLASINHLQMQVSSNAITTAQLLDKVNALLSTSATRIFGKEHNFLWERDTTSLTARARNSLQKAVSGEKKALHYYFKDSGNKRLFLLLIGVVFFIWLFRNIRTVRRLNAMDSISHLSFEYLPANQLYRCILYHDVCRGAAVRSACAFGLY